MATRSLQQLQQDNNVISINIGNWTSVDDFTTFDEAYTWLRTQDNYIDSRHTVRFWFRFQSHYLGQTNYVLDKAGTYIFDGEDGGTYSTVYGVFDGEYSTFSVNRNDATWTETSTTPKTIRVHNLDFRNQLSTPTSPIDPLFTGTRASFYFDNVHCTDYYKLLESYGQNTGNVVAVNDCTITQSVASSGQRPRALEAVNFESVKISNTTITTIHPDNYRNPLEVDTGVCSMSFVTFNGWQWIFNDNYANIYITDNMNLNGAGFINQYSTINFDGKGKFVNNILHIDQDGFSDVCYPQARYRVYEYSGQALDCYSFAPSGFKATGAAPTDFIEIRGAENQNRNIFTLKEPASLSENKIFSVAPRGGIWIDNYSNNPLFTLNNHRNHSDVITINDQNNTIGNMLKVYHTASTMTGDVFNIDMANTTGSFDGNYLNFINNTSTVFKVDSSGTITTPSSLTNSYTVTTSGDIALDLGTYNHFNITANGDINFTAPNGGSSMITAGWLGNTGIIVVRQQTPGGHDINWVGDGATYWGFPNGAPAFGDLATTTNHINIFRYTVTNHYHVHVEFIAGYEEYLD